MLCICWTAAKRMPISFRSIGEMRVPFTITLQQLLVTIISFAVLYPTRGLWGFFLPPAVKYGMLFGVPLLGAMVFRTGQIEGRSLHKFVRGQVVYLLSSMVRRKAQSSRRHKYNIRTVEYVPDNVFS